MKAMVLNEPHELGKNPAPLQESDLPVPVPTKNEILVHVSVCGVCHTELDIIENRTPAPHFPIVLGHQVVGVVAALGTKVDRFTIGDRVGIAWIHSACGKCSLCLSGHENLCGKFKATGRDVNGGYAQYMTVEQGFAYSIPSFFSDTEAAPLLCAGAIGYRSLRLSGLKNGGLLGLSGFGASAHLVLKMTRHLYPDTKVFVFARSAKERKFAKELGAAWAGAIDEDPDCQINCTIDTTPAWQPVVASLKNLAPAGRLIINAIGKEDRDKESLQQLHYPTHLWQEKEIKSVANVCRRDVSEFLELAADMRIKPETQIFRLEEANKALMELKTRKIKGAKVLKIA